MLNTLDSFKKSPHKCWGLLFQPSEKKVRMRGRRYRFKTATLAIMPHDGQKILITIPTGGEIEVYDPLDGDRLLDVEWEGTLVMMFAIDIRERAERIDVGSRR